MKDAAGKYRVPVAHEVQVAAVVARDVLDAVGEVLATGEELFQVAEAAGHGLAADVDDFRPRQHEVDEADVTEVVGHLVDEEGRGGVRRGRPSPGRARLGRLSPGRVSPGRVRSGGASVGARVRQIALSQGAEVTWPQGGQH